MFYFVHTVKVFLLILLKIFNAYFILIYHIYVEYCFLGLRGAISYALSLHLEFSDETRHVIITTTLCIILVTTLLFGGSTMPLMKVMYIIVLNNVELYLCIIFLFRFYNRLKLEGVLVVEEKTKLYLLAKQKNG